MEILKFITAGSVDDGKSTLIGRLLYETGNIPKDEFNFISSKYLTANGQPDFSRFTDGLADERAKGITIDVAYRYFFTTNRKYVIADSPGHKEFTRNMFTAASNADLAIILVDGLCGVTEQTKRHSYIVDFLGIKQLIYAVNKMDLLNYQENEFISIQSDLLALSNELNSSPVVIPISALNGENLVVKSHKMNWYAGPTLLTCLENSNPKTATGNAAALWVQHASKVDNKWIAMGKVLQGSFSLGNVVKLPGDVPVNILSAWKAGSFCESLLAQEAASLKLESEVSIERGDLLVNGNLDIRWEDRIKVRCCYFSENPARIHSVFWIKVAGMVVKGEISSIKKRLAIETGILEENVESIELNDFVWLELQLDSPILYSLGSIPELSRGILIDPSSNFTAAAFLV